MTHHLITIGPSHYCDKARKAMQIAKLPFIEEPHLPMFHIPAVKRSGGVRSTPVLALQGRTLSDSSDILAYIQTHPRAKWHPYGATGDARTKIEDWETRFDETLGPHSRRLAYYFLLPHRSIALPILSSGVPNFEALSLKFAYPVFRTIMAKLLNISKQGAERSRGRIQEVFDDVAQALKASDTQASANPYLVGEALTAADLTFATLAAPILGIDAYFPNELLPIAWPRELQAEFERWRDHPAGRWAQEIYRELDNRAG